MFSLALIGGGAHSRSNHLPALAHYVAQRPDTIRLAAFCDLDPKVAEATAHSYGFERHYCDYREMLAAGDLDACIAVTPLAATASIAADIIEARLPLLMEKPPGLTLESSEHLRQLANRRNSIVMVSMNRRFDPALQTAKAWIGDRPLTHVRVTMLRIDRTEETFLVETGLHSADALRYLAGDIREHVTTNRRVDQTTWYSVALALQSGATGTLDIMPSCGCKGETYELFGPGYRVEARAGDADTGTCLAWENGTLALHAESDVSPFIKNGTYAETSEFLDGTREGRHPRPSLDDVLPSVEFIHQIHSAATDNAAAHELGHPARRARRPDETAAPPRGHTRS